MKTKYTFIVLSLVFLHGWPVAAGELQSGTPESPAAVLQKEHGVILSVVNAMRGDVEALRAGKEVSAERMRKALDFFENFADACHHRKEEEHYFPAVESAGGMPQHVMISSFLNDHALYRVLLGRIRSGIQGDSVDPSVAEPLALYLSTVSLHIFRENKCFGKAAPWLDSRKEEDLLGEFHALEKELGSNYHRKYSRLARELTGK